MKLQCYAIDEYFNKKFNRYSKKSYIIKLLKENSRVILDENENYNSVADMILQKNGIKNYKRYIDNMFVNRTIDRNPFIEVELSVKKICNDNIFENKICFYPTCLNLVSGDNYSHLHNKSMIENYKLIVCGLDVKLSVIYLLSLKFEISSFICNSVINLPSLRDIL